jgi:hypothetical protein
MKRRDEADLNKEATNAAGFYVKRAGGNAVPLKEKTDMLNFVAHGFYMGWRECEKINGARNNNSDVGRIK